PLLFYLGKEKLRHSLGRPSRSDFVQFQFIFSFTIVAGLPAISTFLLFISFLTKPFNIKIQGSWYRK
ncbi:hypothetical protein, partial [Roseburia faecis]|uniref:hypothetical protein n=1 Tax=Roseburia faecis TaxID=301302 RepID=UPI0032BFACB7